MMLRQKELCIYAEIKDSPHAANVVVAEWETLQFKLRHLSARVLFAFLNA
jgi:hypothetical protein